METKYLIDLVNKLLKDYKLKRKRSSWYYFTDECIVVFNLQRSLYSSVYYINIGTLIKKIYDKLIYPKEYECHLKIRVNDGEGLFDLENKMSDEEREIGIKKIIEEEIIGKIIQFSTIEGILKLYKDDPSIMTNTFFEYIKRLK
jgi:hypothetical protein